MRIYLAGPMTGIHLWNFPAFYSTAAFLQDRGNFVWNPAQLDEAFGFDPTSTSLPPGFIRQAIKRDIDCIFHADAIALMPGWERSKGVAVELALAKYLGLKVLDGTTGQEFPTKRIPA